MIRVALERIFDEYPNARKQQFSDHPLAYWIRHELPRIFESATSDYPNIAWRASAGKGRWSDAPWIAAFDPLVTVTAQEGYYPVYLFTSNIDAVYLSMNQGMSQL